MQQPVMADPCLAWVTPRDTKQENTAHLLFNMVTHCLCDCRQNCLYKSACSHADMYLIRIAMPAVNLMAAVGTITYSCCQHATPRMLLQLQRVWQRSGFATCNCSGPTPCNKADEYDHDAEITLPAGSKVEGVLCIMRPVHAFSTGCQRIIIICSQMSSKWEPTGSAVGCAAGRLQILYVKKRCRHGFSARTHLLVSLCRSSACAALAGLWRLIGTQR